MKKPTLIVTLLALTLAGCEENRTLEQKEPEIADDITEFNYKGHRYIGYCYYAGSCSIGGITHDPDCPCHQKGEKQ